MNNNHHRGHGVAIHYSPSSVEYVSNNTFAITNCNFSNNHGTSLIYIKRPNKDNFRAVYIYVNNLNFYNNQGVPIYIYIYIKVH